MIRSRSSATKKAIVDGGFTTHGFGVWCWVCEILGKFTIGGQTILGHLDATSHPFSSFESATRIILQYPAWYAPHTARYL
jgi:hypothetical protein